MGPGRRGIRLTLAAALAVVALALAACGEEENKSEIVEGEPVELGPLEYNVLFSRFLNPNDTEDAAYLEGQPPPDPGSIYFGVFAQVENHGDEPEPLPDSFLVVDAEEKEYEAIESESPYALPLGGEVPADQGFPRPDSIAAIGPIQGNVLLFEITDTSTENRPLKLIIEGEEGPAEVELDL